MFKLDDKIEFNEKLVDVLSVGEILVDCINNSYERSKEYSIFFGGSPSNVSFNLNKLGFISYIVSAVGNDFLGDFLIREIENKNFSTKYIQKKDRATSLVFLSKSKDTPVPIFYRDADYHMDINEELLDLVRKSKVLHFSCWPISKEHSRNTIKKLIEIAKKSNTLIGFEPNHHTKLWENNDEALRNIEKFISVADFVKPSLDDANRIFGENSCENHIKKFLSLGAKLVIFTLGSEGLIASNGEETVRMKSIAKEVVDTTGAGDAFWSGFYAGILLNNSISKSLEIGGACSAYKLQSTGASAEFPKLDIVLDKYNIKGD